MYSPNCHDIARISLRNEVICNCVHCRFNNLINKQHKQWIRFGFWVGKTLLLQVLLACNNVVNHEHQRHMLQHPSCSRRHMTLHDHVTSHDSSWSCDVTWLQDHVTSHDSSLWCDVTWLHDHVMSYDFMLMWWHVTHTVTHIVYSCEMHATTLCWSRHPFKWLTSGGTRSWLAWAW